MIAIEFMDIRDQILVNKVVGPFDNVQATYGTLRDQDGETIAVFDDKVGLWWLINGSKFGYYSDFVIMDVHCTSDDPTNHQGDTCPIHELGD